ncbi:site-specific DNA-methyltransferase [candidate division WOR-3 bacterium]|nr:site-specific DNA-methyltransferase [candidate division WOR-3 bacterium]
MNRAIIVSNLYYELRVLDPFMGSGTTAIAALKSNRNYVGFEIKKEYIDLAKNRIKPYENMMKFD